MAIPTDPEHSRVRSNSKSREQRLGKYRITGKLGKGGMGVVYAAEDTLLHRPVAIKVLSSAMAKDPQSLERFLREARAVAKLNHPNVVSIYEIDQKDGLWYLGMELVGAGSLQGMLKEQGALDWKTASRWIRDACRGLAAAHAAGLVHRDIKPANLMLASDSSVKLADFGLVKSGDDTSGITATGTVLGTPYFMSPEQWRAETLTDLSDVYSLGATYYNLLTGRPPYSGLEPMQVMYACCTEPPADPQSIRADIPAECVVIVKRAMAKEPADRYHSVGQMQDELSRLIDGATPVVPHTPMLEISGAVRTATSLPTMLPKSAASLPKLSRRTMVLGAAGALLLGGGVTWALRSPAQGKRKVTKHGGGAGSPGQAANAATTGDADDVIKMFNGRNLDGWNQYDPAKGTWKVENGVLVGRGHPHGSYLYSNREDFANFHLRAEVMINDAGNGGLYFRCARADSQPNGYEAQIGPGNFGELHRNMLHAPSAKLQNNHNGISMSPGEWKMLEVLADGPRITLRLGSQVLGSLEDIEHPDVLKVGGIALQAFDENTELRIRSIVIQTLP